MLAKDTVRLIVQFKDFQGNHIAPEDVSLKIYDINYQLLETITEGVVNDSQGKFYYDYVATDSDFIFEFSGFYFGKPVLAREKVQVKFY